MHTNIRSVIPKRDSLCGLISSSSCNVVLLTETWLNSSIRDSEILPLFPDFDIFRKDRVDNTRGGGVLIATSHELRCIPILIQSPLEMLWLCCTASFPRILLGICYRPPSADAAFLPAFHDALGQITKSYPNTPVLLFGDFNFPSIAWSNLASTLSKSNMASEFVNTCLTFGLSQVVNNPTRTTDHSDNILDLILTSHPENLSDIAYLNGLSDHKILHATFSCHMSNPTRIKKTLTLYDRGDYNSMSQDLTTFYDNFEADFHHRSLETNWLLFKSEFLRLVKRYVPTITISERKQSPWFNTTLKRLNNKKKRLFRSANSSQSDFQWQKYHAAVKQYEKHVADAKRGFFSTTLPSMLHTNPKRFWQCINPQVSSSVFLRDSAGCPVPESETADALNTAFCSVFTNACPEILPHLPPSNYPPMENITFDANGIVTIIESLKNSSSCGIDGINAKVLKNTKHITSLFLRLIFQQSLCTGSIPSDWKVGKIIPIFKKGDRTNPSNYRPISLTSVCSKLMEHILHSHIANFLSSLNFFHPNQHGFRKAHSCNTQLALFLHDVHSNLDLNIATDALFLDFEKAFDKVSHILLMHKVSHLNLHPDTVNWIREFLTDRLQFVSTNSFSSSLSPVLSGVPQGSVLGPLLFLIYINDLPVNVSSNIRLFADDCVLYRPITNSIDSSSLQDDLLKIQAWCNQWYMSLNVSKCSHVSFHRRRNYVAPSYSLNNNTLTQCKTFKYLGVHISSDLSWAHHILQLTNSCNRLLGYLRRNLSSASPAVKLLAYKTLIRSKLEYASAIYDNHQVNINNSLESVQNRAARFILSDYSYRSSVSALKSQLCLPSLSSRRKTARLILFFRFFHSLPPGNQIIIPAHRSSRHSHQNAVYLPRAHTTTYQRSFFLHTAGEWNALPSDIALITDIAQFKAAIEDHLSRHET